MNTADIALHPLGDLQTCEELLREGSRSFYAASRALPRRLREPVAALYAFCRVADDAIDLGLDRPHALASLHLRLDALYAGQPQPMPADRALSLVVRQFAIPKLLLEALLEGFAWDAQGRRYETLTDLYDYAARVAGTVGAMTALVMGVRSPTALARACELGVAMQLTNIARDVGEDARAGRLYLPLQWLREAGLDPETWLETPVFGPPIAIVTQRLLQAADALYRQAQRGVAELPRDCRPAIQAARLVYAEIGRVIEAHGLDSVNRRAVVSDQRRWLLLARAAVAAVRAPACKGAHPTALPAIGYLVDAACCRDLPASTFYQRTVRVIDLFDRVAQRRRQASTLAR